MANFSLEQRLELARTALVSAEKNARDPNKNPAYWKGQAEQEKRLVESLEAEIRQASTGV
jgi:hypothetical protein